MKGPGWQPTRRNRNIGTAKQGYSQNNKMVIPDHWNGSDWLEYYERLIDPVTLAIRVREHTIQLYIEPTIKGFYHACTPHDLVQILPLFPDEHLEDIEAIVLRQPKRKELILKSVWGRLVYFATLPQCSGTVVYLDAQESHRELKWSNRLDPFWQKELSLLREDGHEICQTKREFVIRSKPKAVRTTQLFYTLAHEIGHSVDYQQTVWWYDDDSEEAIEARSNIYWSKPSLDKEEFAKRYAREFYKKWQERGVLPFSRIFDADGLIEYGLKPAWFTA